MIKPRILIIDNDPKVGSDLSEILRPEGYDVRVVRKYGSELIVAAKTTSQQFRPHVAIVDLRLNNDFDTADKSGLKLLSTLGSAYCVLFTAYLSFDLIRDITRPGLVSWRSKGEHPDKLLEDIRSAIQRDTLARRPLKLRGCTSTQIVQVLFGKDTDAPPDLVNTVINRLFPNAHRIVLDPLPVESENSPAVSRRHSVVLKARVDNLEPVVVKLAPAKQIRLERCNYQRVNGRLVGQFRAEIYHTAEFWDLGGAVYSFLGSSLQSLPSFEAYYRAEEQPESVLKPLTHLFGEVWGRLYLKTAPTRCRSSLFQRYDRALHIRKHLKKLDAYEETLSFPSLSYPLINPVRWIFDHQDQSLIEDARLAVTHGDLHSQNLFVDGEHAWTIDFERTGAGHSLRDFIELEIDITTRLIPFSEDDLTPFFRFAVSMAAQTKPESPSYPLLVADFHAQKALEIIAGIRKLAYEATGYQDSREYLWGLLLNAIFVGSLAEERSTQRCRAIILASVLCERLSRWDQEWPPAEWLPVLQDRALAQTSSADVSTTKLSTS